MRVRLSFPQGSTLGTLLYVTYAAELQTVAERHGVRFHGFADDTQLRISVGCLFGLAVECATARLSIRGLA